MLLRTLERVVALGVQQTAADTVFEIVEQVTECWTRAEWLAAFSTRYGGYSLDGLGENQQNALLRGGIIMAQGFINLIDTRAADARDRLTSQYIYPETPTHAYLFMQSRKRSIPIDEPLPTDILPHLYHHIGTAMVCMDCEGLQSCVDTLAGQHVEIIRSNPNLARALEPFRTLFANTIAQKAFPAPVRLERLPLAVATDLPSVRRELNSFIRIAREITARATPT
jgi:hypothetical protein